MSKWKTFKPAPPLPIRVSKRQNFRTLMEYALEYWYDDPDDQEQSQSNDQAQAQSQSLWTDIII